MIQFEFSSFMQEIDGIRKIASSKFLDAGAEGVFDSAISQLKSIQQYRSTSEQPWEVSQSMPLKTKPSMSWERGGKAAFPLVGSISWKWSLLPNIESKKRLTKAFSVPGKASLIVKFLKPNEDCAVAEWKVDLGAFDSPGCYFHSHIAKNSCVPRLPSLFVTPMDVLEFTLGELFQSDWEQHASSETPDVQFWRTEKRKLLGRVLDWKKGQILGGTGSPWVRLKKAKPSDVDKLFLPVP